MPASFVARSGSPTRHRFNRPWMYVFAALLIGESSGCNGNHTPPPGPSGLTLSAGLAVTAVTPAAGSTEGGTWLLLNGASFQHGLVASIDGVAQQTFFGTSTIASLYTTPHAAGPVDIVITNPDGTTTRVTGRYAFALPQSFDFNGTWSVYRDGSEDFCSGSPFRTMRSSASPAARRLRSSSRRRRQSSTVSSRSRERSAVCPDGLSRRGKRRARSTFPVAGPGHGAPRSRRSANPITTESPNVSSFLALASAAAAPSLSMLAARRRRSPRRRRCRCRG